MIKVKLSSKETLALFGKICFHSCMEEICKKVIKDAGGPAKLARALGDLTSQAVSQWKRIPVDRVIAVEALSGVSRHKLRPDIFGPVPARGEAA